MNNELDIKLNADYPELFAGSGSKILRCEHDDGWFGLIDSLCHMLVQDVRLQQFNYERLRDRLGQPLYAQGEVVTQEMIDHALHQWEQSKLSIPQLRQVKEKYGTLCVYAHPLSQSQRDIIRFAEMMSSRVCESCGSMDQVKTYMIGWNKTLCPIHAKEKYGSALEDG